MCLMLRILTKSREFDIEDLHDASKRLLAKRKRGAML